MTTDDFEGRLAAVEARNVRVESEKAWEGSWTRRVSIALVTYFVVLAYGYAIGAERPYLNAVVPTVGFLLSTWAVPLVKRFWISRRHRSQAT